MPEYYCFPTEADANICIDSINATNWFPVVGSVKKIPAPNNQQTTSWCNDAKEIVGGGWAVPRIPESSLDFLNVPQSERDAFLLAFGSDIRTLLSTDLIN